MKENLPYFRHDNDALEDEKCQALLAQYGFAGYGKFWALNESISKATAARLDLSRKVIRAQTAVKLQFTLAEFDAFLSFLSNPDECGLIQYESGIVTTKRTQQDLAAVMENRIRKRKDGKPVNHAENDFSAQDQENGAPESQNGAAFTRIVEESRREEFDASALKIPSGICQKFTPEDLAELKAMFNGRSQEALDAFALYLDAGDYSRYARPWSRVKTWLKKETKPQDWLDRASGKSLPLESVDDSHRFEDPLHLQFSTKGLTLE